MFGIMHEQYPVLIGVVIGLIAILWPPPKRTEVEAQRQARLAELANGAEERFFEERRSLETYGRASAGPYRLWGCIILALSIALLFL